MSNSNKSDDDALIKKVKHVLGEPSIEEFSDNTLRIRRNLIAVSAIALFYRLNHLQITGGTFFGVNFNNLTDDAVGTALFLIVLYNFIHFLVNSWEHIYFTRIRITGTKVRHVTVGKSASEYGDYPNNPKQSSLYNWWIENNWKTSDFQSIQNKIEEFRKKLNDFVTQRQESDRNTIHNEVATLQNHISGIGLAQGELLKVISSERIAVSLERFDTWFWSYQKIQLWRWIILEWAAPIILGACALGTTWPHHWIN